MRNAVRSMSRPSRAQQTIPSPRNKRAETTMSSHRNKRSFQKKTNPSTTSTSNNTNNTNTFRQLERERDRQRPFTVGRSTGSRQRARLLLAQQRSGAKSVADTRLSNLLVESSLLGADPTHQYNNSFDSFGEVATDREWFDREDQSSPSSSSSSSSSKRGGGSQSFPNYRSGAIRVEILLKEALTAVENHKESKHFRTAVAFDALTRIIPQLGGFERVMKMISLELLTSVYPKSSDNSVHSFESMPFYTMARSRGQKIEELEQALSELQKRHDHVLTAQLASGGSINVVVNRWRRKLLDSSFNTWRTVAAIQCELKTSSAKTMQKILARKKFAQTFHKWRRWTMEELLERATITALVVGEQAEDLERSGATIKKLREDVDLQEQEIATLIAENGRLKLQMYDAAAAKEKKEKKKCTALETEKSAQDDAAAAAASGKTMTQVEISQTAMRELSTLEDVETAVV